MMKKNVAVIMGGFSSEAEVSIKSGKTVIEHLPKEKYNAFAIHIDKDDWYMKDDEGKYPIDKNDFSIEKKGKKLHFDVVFNAIHGTPGEDGAILPYFEILGIPHTSAAFDKMALTFNKKNTIAVLRSYGIPTGKSVFLHKNDPLDLKVIEKQIGYPLFVKPNRAGSSYGISKVYKKEELMPAIQEAFKEDKEIIIEEFLDGREFSVGVIKYKGEIKVLPITEIISENDFFDYEAKYLGKSQEITPASLPNNIQEKIEKVAKKVYEVLDLNGISRAEYILVNNTPYFLEINMVPGLTEASIFPQQAEAAGIKLSDLFDNAIEMATK
jgi:D-alanine-D-alanine ligase